MAARAIVPGAPGDGSSPSATTPARLDPAVATLATHRALLGKGLSVDEAANLTAFLCGIPLREVTWSLAQVNRLLFLRELHRSGRIGADDRLPSSLH